MNRLSDATSFRRSLISWYREAGRDLPWRRTTDAYPILVSEFMLQQTQVTAVIPHFERWMERFPDFASVAAAPEDEVLHAWQGLGYYRRALNLRRSAQIIGEMHQGCFPRSVAAMGKLPGIGRYTAAAIATFAFNQSVPVVEANITRVLARLFNLKIAVDTNSGRKALWHHATELLPKRDARTHNSALMDLGALICKARPNCPACPVRSLCRAHQPLTLPIRKARPLIKHRTENHGLIIDHGRVLLEQSKDRWRGMWILPPLTRVTRKHRPLHICQFPFTNHQITLTVFPRSAAQPSIKSRRRWFSIAELDSIPLPSPHRRALESLLSRSHKTIATP